MALPSDVVVGSQDYFAVSSDTPTEKAQVDHITHSPV